MTKRNPPLFQKDPVDGTTANSYRPPMCLPMRWKLLTTQMKEIHDSVLWRTQKVQQATQRIWRFTIHCPTHPKEGQTETIKSSYGVDWFKVAYVLTLQSWIIHYQKIYKISDVIILLRKLWKNWWVELKAGGKNLTEMKIQEYIIQGDALSPLLLW